MLGKMQTIKHNGFTFWTTQYIIVYLNATFSYQLFARSENVISILAVSQITFCTQSIVLQQHLKQVTFAKPVANKCMKIMHKTCKLNLIKQRNW